MSMYQKCTICNRYECTCGDRLTDDFDPDEILRRDRDAEVDAQEFKRKQAIESEEKR